MTELTQSREIQAFLDRLSGLDGTGGGKHTGDERAQRIVRKIVGDLFETIDEFDINESEFWSALAFVAEGAPEFGLWAAGLGIEHFLDVRMDIADRKAGIDGGTPRTIEGPLHVCGAPLVKGEARLDDGSDKDGHVLIMQGVVKSVDGTPIADAIVDVWHANTLGNYSGFDRTQSEFNMRRRIQTDAAGRYRFRSILPSGYSCPPGGTTDRLLEALGRHGRRPAHIHFFVTSPGHRHLTTQINIQGDPDIHDDFAYATRDDLVPALTEVSDKDAIAAAGLSGPFARIDFDFTLIPAEKREQEKGSARPRHTQEQLRAA